ncbi:MAG: FAD-dependent oxidoreductase, partial [Dehalococcoidia bacterium]|nr:FAD-dependent oxidoreductase [Dehalococcoidia bacterium]
YYEALARGGVGLIIGGATPLFAFTEKHIPGYKALTDMVHKYDCPIFCQFMHLGAWVPHPDRMKVDKDQMVSASAIPLSEMQERGPDFPMASRELTVPEIKDIVNDFASVAERARRAGFDGIEINSATAHLANSFLSRAWNRRQDEYGCQSLENRARFAIEIKDAIKKRLGQAVPLGIYINGAEFGIKDGLTVAETQGLARIFEQAGFDYIGVRSYGYGDYYDLHLTESILFPEPPEPVPPLDINQRGMGISVPVAAAIKKVVSIPVIHAGKLDAELGEKILEEGKVDFVGLVRPLIADPEYINKVAAGRMEDITPCIRCLMCFATGVDHGGDMHCTVNGAMGGEHDYVFLPPAQKKKKVVVVGGGPAGLEAARVAALRGHEVTLYEKGKRLGGLLLVSSFLKGDEVEDLEAWIKYYKTQLDKLGVKVVLGTEVNEALIEQIKPDVVIIAIGGKPTVPEVPGVNGRNVLTAPELYRKVKRYLDLFGPRTLRWLTKFYLPVEKRVLVMGGRGQRAAVAEFMVKRGREVTIIDIEESLEDPTWAKARNLRLFRWFTKKGVTMMTEVKYDEITDKGISIITKDGKRQILEVDTIIPVLPLAQDTELFESLKGKVPEVYCVGDCREPHARLEAVGDGYRVARKI